MNIPLLRKVSEHILAEPRRVNMNIGLYQFGDVSIPGWHRNKPPCGTIGCIAGWAARLSGTLLPSGGSAADWEGGIEDSARKALDLTYSQTRRLFHPENWTHDAYRALDRYEPGTPNYARAVADYIEDFIAMETEE